MDRIEFRVVKGEYNDHAASILINGQDLIGMVRKHEEPMAKSEGSLNIAGGYAPYNVRSLGHAHRAVLGGTHYKPKLSLFCCKDCGEVGCWPLDVKITVEDDAVTWSEFEQPHRRETWDYDKFGPFHFDIQQYMDAVKAAGMDQ